MKYFLFFFLIVFACSPSVDSSNVIKNSKKKNFMELTINEYKQMLIYYNDNAEYPNIDK